MASISLGGYGIDLGFDTANQSELNQQNISLQNDLASISAENNLAVSQQQLDAYQTYLIIGVVGIIVAVAIIFLLK